MSDSSLLTLAKDGSAAPPDLPLRAYQREYMRKWRAGK